MNLQSNNTSHTLNKNFPDTFLRHFSKVTCFATLFLIFVGALVKSTESGLAVPDWPLSYGMLFPPMVGGVFYEHGHRMVAAGVGFLMLCLALLLAFKEKRCWVRNLGFSALGVVVLQGLLGGITVLFFLPTPVSVSHGILAQIFFILTITLAYAQSKERHTRELNTAAQHSSDATFLKATLLLGVLILLQLIFGAIMRHTQSGLAIPDFPKMAGYWLPPFNEAMLRRINDWRFEMNLDFVSMRQITYHFLHRAGACVIFVAIIFVNVLGWKTYKDIPALKKLILWLDFALGIQITLGILTLFTLKEPYTTSLHVVNGAACLGLTVLLFLRSAPLNFKELKDYLR